MTNNVTRGLVRGRAGIFREMPDISRSGALPGRENLSRIEDVPRIERLFDGAHEAHAVAVLQVHELGLAVADAVLAGAGAVQRDGAAHQTLVQHFRLRQFRRTGRIDAEAEVEVAVTDVADRRDEERCRL